MGDHMTEKAADEPRRIYPDGESFLAALDDLGPEGDCTPEEAVAAVKASRKAATLGVSEVEPPPGSV